MNFTYFGNDFPRTKQATKASATVITAGRLVGLTAGLIVEATAAHTKVAYCPQGAADGETVVEISGGTAFTLKGTADANFVVTDKALDVDVVLSGQDQLIDLGAVATQVLTVESTTDAGAVGAATDVVVRINKPL